MELTLRSLKGSIKLEGLSNDMTVMQLKELLHTEHKEGRLGVPAPDKQRLVHKDSLLQEGSLTDAGVAPGDDLVLLFAQEVPQPEPLESTPAPNASAIRKAIVAEARRRGTEGQLREDEPSARPRRTFNLPMDMLNTADMDPNLVRLLEQVMGGVPLVPGGQAAAGEQEGEAEEAAPQPIVAPEPTPGNVSQLADMGFPEPVVRKALVLTKDNVQAALEWVLQHMDDADAAEPPTQEQLQQVYGPRRRVRPSPEAMLNQLTEMGFDAESAGQALRRFGNIDLALAFLLSGGAMRGVAASQAAAASAAAPAGHAAQQRAAASGAGASQPAAPSALPHPVDVGDAARGSEQQQAEAGARHGADEGEDAEMRRASAPNTPSAPAEGSDDESMHDAEDDGRSLPMEQESGDGEEHEEDEYEDASYDEAEEEDAYGIEFGDALGSMGSMDLATLNSADMEQLLQGAGVGEMYEHLLFQAGGMEAAGVAGAQDVLLRLMEAPAAIAALQAGAAAAAPGQGQDAAGAEAPAGGQAGAPGGQPNRSSGEGRSQARQQ